MSCCESVAKYLAQTTRDIVGSTPSFTKMIEKKYPEVNIGGPIIVQSVALDYIEEELNNTLVDASEAFNAIQANTKYPCCYDLSKAVWCITKSYINALYNGYSLGTATNDIDPNNPTGNTPTGTDVVVVAAKIAYEDALNAIKAVVQSASSLSTCFGSRDEKELCCGPLAEYLTKTFENYVSTAYNTIFALTKLPLPEAQVQERGELLVTYGKQVTLSSFASFSSLQGECCEDLNKGLYTLIGAALTKLNVFLTLPTEGINEELNAILNTNISTNYNKVLSLFTAAVGNESKCCKGALAFAQLFSYLVNAEIDIYADGNADYEVLNAYSVELINAGYAYFLKAIVARNPACCAAVVQSMLDIAKIFVDTYYNQENLEIIIDFPDVDVEEKKKNKQQRESKLKSLKSTLEVLVLLCEREGDDECVGCGDHELKFGLELEKNK